MGRSARASHGEVSAAEGGEHVNPKVLDFDQPLLSKSGKPIEVDKLVSHLKTLQKEVQDLEQEGVDRPSLATPAKELASVKLLQHPDEGVVAYTACCLADMLRLHAPDAPYTAKQLKDIFACFVKCLKGLENPDAPFYQQYMYLLDSLSTVKSVVLISDIPDGDEITKELFTTFFDIAKPEGPKNVEFQMTDILCQLIEECPSLPPEVVDVICIQFLRTQVEPEKPAKKGALSARADPRLDDRQKKLTNKVLPPAYAMAKQICLACVDKMARYICRYFSEVIVDAAGRRAGTPGGDDEARAHEPTSAEDLGEVKKAHTLARELWKSCPTVLQNVIPLLEHELLADNGELRKLACETIGEMALEGNFAQSAPATWKAWASRANDKSPTVRASWVRAAVNILKTRNDPMAVHMVDLIAIKLNDLDEIVRHAACCALRSLDYDSITSKLAADESPFNLFDSTNSIVATSAIPLKPRGGTGADTTGWGKKILQTLAERVRDKKINVRLEGMRCLARMWDMAYKDISNGNEVVFKQLGWIPSKILDTFYINDPEVNMLLDHVLHEILLPVNYPPIPIEKASEPDKTNGTKGKGKGKELTNQEREKEILEDDKIRVKRLLVLVKGLDTKAKKALFAVPLRQISYAKVMEVFLKSCEENNGGVIEAGVDEATVQLNLEKFSAWLAHKLPESHKAKENLLRLAKLHDRRCYQLIRFCFNPDSDYRTVVRALKEIKKRINESAQPMILDSLTPLLYRVSQIIYNKSHVAPIVEFSRTDECSLGNAAHEVLKEMSSSNPAVFKANVKALSDLLKEQSPGSGSARTSSAVDTLKACAGFAKSYPKDMPQERKLLEALVSFALTGRPPTAAKHAVTILMYSANRKELYASDLVQRCLKDFEFGEHHFLAKLACLSQLVLLAPDQCEDHAKAIKDICTGIIVGTRTERPASEEDKDSKKVWAEETELDDEIRAKILALRVLVNRIRARPDAQHRDSLGVIRSLNHIVANDGEALKTKTTPAAHRSRMRLAAAQHLLKLATISVFDEVISATDFIRLATVAQDGCLQVRRGFMEKLQKYLAAGQLPARFYTIVFLMAYEPEDRWREEVATWIRARSSAISKNKTSHNVVEGVFARLMSLLVHHPDFGTQYEDIMDFAKYILFYLRTVANGENISLIHYVAQRAKQFRDKLSPDNSENLYYISELAQSIIRHYGEIHKWTIQTWPGKMRLPVALYAPMMNQDESHEVAQTTYLPEGMDKKLGALVRASSKNPTSLSSGAITGSSKKRKSESAAITPTPTTTKRVKKPKVEKTPSKPSKKTSTKKQRATKEDGTPPPTKSSERRRSGRQSGRITSYKEEDAETDEEDYEEDDSSDEEMDDASNSGESEAEPEPKPRKYGGRSNSGGGSAKKSTESKGAEKYKEVEAESDQEMDKTPAPEEEMEVDEPEPESAKKEETTPGAPTTTTVAVGKRSTRGSGKTNSKPAEPKKSQTEVAFGRRSTRGAKGKQPEIADDGSESSDLSDVPDADE